jgi:hypothetical protein
LAKPVETKTETQVVMNSLQLDERICGKIGNMNVAKPNLNGWLPVSHTSCVTRYTRFIPSVCYKRAGEKSRPERRAISALANDGFAVKKEAAFCATGCTTNLELFETILPG